jgi:hypothetical protein
MKKMSHAIEGGCMCGQVRFLATGQPLWSGRCHCRSCRLASGAPSVAWVTFRSADFSYTRGEPSSYRSSRTVLRSFCGRCGTPIAYRSDDDPDTLDIATATLDEPDRHRPERETWVSHKLAWEVLDPALPHFEKSSRDGPPLDKV